MSFSASNARLLTTFGILRGFAGDACPSLVLVTLPPMVEDGEITEDAKENEDVNEDDSVKEVTDGNLLQSGWSRRDDNQRPMRKTPRARVYAKTEEKKFELLYLRRSEHHKKHCNFIRLFLFLAQKCPYSHFIEPKISFSVHVHSSIEAT
ncbi:uncharacterized protein LOC133816958 isoform X1 [Humulus lupulus]|uniref:uncharacterized protein LOC133816958 isoform X1 n=1 Tax=Humulus lupulus TaxID=3486 RepID=UPI002B4013B8|nr:uncharacterized protein LOC133816958 isoform X1 [Humulus lupulus]